MPVIWEKAVTDGGSLFWSTLGWNGQNVVEWENSRIYAVHLMTANQSKMRRAHLVSVDIGVDWVENGRTGESPHPEAEKKQAGWVENGRAGESPQPEVAEKQEGWVEIGRAGENPQPEGKEKQAGWVESGRARETPQPEATRSSAR